MVDVAKYISKFSPKEVKHFFDNAKAFKKCSKFTCLLSPKQGEFARILIITPRASGNSPERNLVKRRLRALFYQYKLYEKPYDCAVILKPHGCDASYAALKNLIVKIGQCT
jgi:ribonuclease P protein component